MSALGVVVDYQHSVIVLLVDDCFAPRLSGGRGTELFSYVCQGSPLF